MVLAEELPAAEELGLNLQLRKLMIELPAAIATDLLQGTKTRFDPALKLTSALELIERVYPALDTATTRAEAEQLVERLLGDTFDDSLTPGSSAAPVVVEQPAMSPVAGQAPSTVQVVPGVNAEPESGAPAVIASDPVPAEPTHVTVDQAKPEDTTQDNV
jgi:hypothetical protein